MLKPGMRVIAVQPCGAFEDIPKGTMGTITAMPRSAHPAGNKISIFVKFDCPTNSVVKWAGYEEEGKVSILDFKYYITKAILENKNV